MNVETAYRLRMWERDIFRRPTLQARSTLPVLTHFRQTTVCRWSARQQMEALGYKPDLGYAAMLQFLLKTKAGTESRRVRVFSMSEPKIKPQLQTMMRPKLWIPGPESPQWEMLERLHEALANSGDLFPMLSPAKTSRPAAVIGGDWSRRG